MPLHCQLKWSIFRLEKAQQTSHVRMLVSPCRSLWHQRGQKGQTAHCCAVQTCRGTPWEMSECSSDTGTKEREKENAINDMLKSHLACAVPADSFCFFVFLWCDYNEEKKKKWNEEICTTVLFFFFIIMHQQFCKYSISCSMMGTLAWHFIFSWFTRWLPCTRR